MVIGVMFSGVLAGLSGVAWALAAGFPLLVALMCYPAVGAFGAVAILTLVLLRIRDEGDFSPFGTA